MARSDRKALIAAIILGVVAAALSIAAVYAAGIVFVIFAFINPLVVSFLAQHRMRSLSLLSNLIMAALVTAVIVILGGATVGRYDASELALALLVTLAAAIIPALVISAVVRFVRARRLSPE